nr:ribonuclease H-like domain-containing protein [Tanacetum cinerariifolium]
LLIDEKLINPHDDFDYNQSKQTIPFEAGWPTTRRSISGYCVFLGNNLLSWSSKRQPTLSRSSADAEYRGVANVVAETCWIRNLLRELYTPLSSATIVYFDNVRVLHVPSRFQYADIFTKGLPSALFDEFRNSLSMDVADAFSSLDIADTNVSAPYLDPSQMVIAWDMENCHVSTKSGIIIAQASVNITKASLSMDIDDTNVSAPYLDPSQMVIAWDMENCHVSTKSGITIAQASVNITKAVQISLNNTPIRDFCVYGKAHSFSRNQTKSLEYGGIKFFNTFSESADMMIIIGIFEFAFECPPPAYIMLISANAN